MAGNDAIKAVGEEVWWSDPIVPAPLADLNGDGVKETIEVARYKKGFKRDVRDVRDVERRIDRVSVRLGDQEIEATRYQDSPKGRELFSFQFQNRSLLFRDRGGRPFAVDGFIRAIRVYLDLNDLTFVQREALIGNDWVLLENLQYVECQPVKVK